MLFAIFSFLSILISFYLKIDLSTLSTGGVTSDLNTHWNYILLLNKDINNLINLELGVDYILLSFPLHHLIFSLFDFLVINQTIFLNYFFILSFIIPFIFFIIIKKEYPHQNFENHLFLASLVVILPAYQYSSIWGNPHTTALIFLLFAFFFIKKFQFENFTKNKFTYLSIFFLGLASYTRQYYIIFFPYIFLIFIKNISFKENLKLIIFTILLGIPGLIFITKNLKLITGLHTLNITNFNTSILISYSIIFFYILPFIIQYFLNDKSDFIKQIKKKIIITFGLTFLIVIILNFNFYYDSSIGGGIFFKISNILFNNNILLLITSFFGIFFTYFYCQKNIENLYLLIIFGITFTSGFFVFQKYFEPLFLIIFLIFFDKEKILKSISKSKGFIAFYFGSYYLMLNFLKFNSI